MLDRSKKHDQTPPIRQWMLLGLVVLQSVAVIILLMTARVNTSALQLENANTIMNQLAENVLERTQRFLEPAEHATRLLKDLFERQQLTPRTSAFEAFLLTQIRNAPQLTGIYFGGINGDFFFARREQSGFSLKTIVHKQTIQTTIRQYTSELVLVSNQVIAGDGYDPRQRPWYTKATARGSLIWTGPYIFFTSQRPGITAAIPVFQDSGAQRGVIGADIEISVLGKFIATIPTSPHGEAFIATKTGEVVGMPGLEQKVPEKSRDLPKLQDMGSEAAKTLAGSQNSRDFKNIQVKNEPWVGIVRPLLVNSDAEWQLGIYAPRSDFVGNTENMFNRQLWQTLGIGLVSLLAAIALIWQVSSPIEQWYKRATTDELTHLLNRTEFLAKSRAILPKITGTSVIVMFDLDKFKTVNDVFGHEAGDKVLKTIAQRLRQRVRSYDVVARFGGDEFAILLPGITLETASQRLEQWRTEMVEPFRQLVSVSVGMTSITNADELEEKLAEADQALLSAKKAGKNQVQWNQSSGRLTN